MSPPQSGKDSPFAVRTRAPFPGQGGSTPPVVAGSTSSGASTSEKSRAPLVAGILGGLALAAGVVWWATAGKDTKPEPVAAPAPVSATAIPEARAVSPGAASLAQRDPKADYEALAGRAASFTLEPPERAAVAEATLRASGGAYAEALEGLGRVVTRRLQAGYDARAEALRGVKLEDYSTPGAQALRTALSRADQAAQGGVWAEQAARLEEAASLVPTAQAEIAARLGEVAKAAVERGDTELATYFYERVLRLEPGQAEARAHLFAHKFKAGQIVRSPGGLELAYVPPGEFLRGSRAAEPGRSADEEQAKVRLKEGLFFGVTEVTQRQWDLVFGAGAAARALSAARAKSDTVGPDLPMHSVRWDEARAFCEKLTALDGLRYRLPTEAEWEYACRAGTTTAFNLGGDGLSARDANIDDGSAAVRLAPEAAGSVGRANAWGLRDMHGNVWEWCADWSAPYAADALEDPRGPADDAIGRVDLAMKVVRGGGWNAPASEARSANRWEYSPAVATAYIGFRVVQEPALTSP